MCEREREREREMCSFVMERKLRDSKKINVDVNICEEKKRGREG